MYILIANNLLGHIWHYAFNLPKLLYVSLLSQIIEHFIRKKMDTEHVWKREETA